MARRVDKPQDSAGESPALDAVAALVPDVKVTVAGRDLVFREYAVFEGYEVAFAAREFIADLHDQAKTGGIKYANVRRLIGPHQAVIVQIAALSAGVDEAWIRGLGREDADQFFAAWFVANAGFFVREVLFDIQQEQADQGMDSRSTDSSSGFPGPGSGTSDSSSDAPSGS